MTVLTDVERRLTRILAGWAALSVGAGVAARTEGRRRTDPTLTSFGQQTAAWGLVDGAIAAAGIRARRKPRKDPAEQTRRLRKLLWLNAGFDVAYITGGVLWLRRNTPSARGNGAAVVVQGAFLLVLDVVHARQLSGSNRR